jgi:hypothetical protein
MFDESFFELPPALAGGNGVKRKSALAEPYLSAKADKFSATLATS